MPTVYPAASSIAAGGVRFARSIWINSSTFGRGFWGDECAMAHAILASLVIERRNAHVQAGPPKLLPVCRQLGSGAGGRGKSQAWCRAGNAHFVGLVRVSGWPVVKADPATLVCASCAGGMQPG